MPAVFNPLVVISRGSWRIALSMLVLEWRILDYLPGPWRVARRFSHQIGTTFFKGLPVYSLSRVMNFDLKPVVGMSIGYKISLIPNLPDLLICQGFLPELDSPGELSQLSDYLSGRANFSRL